jgi:1-acyl-sn-glycerol-3-phosphate acyltransferase
MLRQWAGSIAFTLCLFVTVPPYALWVAAAGLRGSEHAYRRARAWVGLMLAALQKLCSLSHRVAGLEHLPRGPAVVLVKHSSAWETMAQLLLFPRQTWVLKRELMWAPFFGWVLRLLRPIAIDRRGGKVAVQQVIEQGLDRLADGLWVVIFPEGTRVPNGQSRRYGISGVLLAQAAGLPVIPVAHNAGRFWPRRGWLKRAGTIDVVVGPAVPTVGRDAREVTEEIQAWIEGQIARLNGATPAADDRDRNRAPIDTRTTSPD